MAANPLDTKIKTREEVILELNKTIGEKEAEIHTKKEEIGRLDEILGQRQRTLDRTDEIFKELQDTYNSQGAELKLKVHNAAKLLPPLEAQALQYRTEIKQAKRNLPIIEQQAASRKASLEREYGNRKKQLEAEVKTLNGEVLGLSQRVRELTAGIAELEKQKDQLAQDTLTMQVAYDKKKADHEAEVAKYGGIVNNLRAQQVEQRKANNAAIKAANDQLRDIRAKTDREIERLNSKEAIVDAKLARLRHLEKLEKEQERPRRIDRTAVNQGVK
jgi:chromosome segregation ATPase